MGQVEASMGQVEASMLWYASRYGDFEQAKRAILNGADVNAKDNDGWTALHLACADVYRNDAVVTLLLQNGADVNAKKNDGFTPLHYASSNGYEAMVSILLENGADPTITNNYGRTPLQIAQAYNQQNCVAAIERFQQRQQQQREQQQQEERQQLQLEEEARKHQIDKLLFNACSDGDLEMAERAIENGADVNAKEDEWGETLLHVASSKGQDAVVSLLLEKGADVNAKGFAGWTPLHNASRYGYDAVVSLLLEKHADVNAKNKFGNTPLHYACMYGYENIVALLLENGADVNAQDNDGMTPLHKASSYGREAIISLLLEKGADVNAENRDGKTPLHYASPLVNVVSLLSEKKQREEEARQHQIDKLLLNACSDGDLEKAKRAIENGADVNAKDAEGWTPLHKASLCGHEAVVSLLVEKGAHVNAKDNNGMTPLHLTIFDEHEAIVSLLLENGADVNAKKNDGWSPLHYASWNGNEAIISVLLENGAYVNVKAKDGSTPLHWACANRYGGKDAVVSLLLEKGADPTITNDDGKTPLQLAQKYKKQHCVAVIEQFQQRQQQEEQKQREERQRLQREEEALLQRQRQQQQEESAKKKRDEELRRRQQQDTALKKQKEELRRQRENEELERRRQEEVAKKEREAEQKRLETEKKKELAQKKQEAEQAAKREEQLKKQQEMETLTQLEKTYSSKFETRASLDRELKRLQDLVNDAKGSFDPALNAVAEIAFLEYQTLLPLCQSPKYASATDLGMQITSLEERIMKMQIGKERTKAAKELHELKQRLNCEQRGEASHDPNDRIAAGRAVLVQALDSSATTTEANQIPWEYIEHITSNFENVIASGGFGTVYRGTDMNANAEVAIKALRSDRMSARDKEDFEKEVLCLSELSHPNIVRLLAKSVTNTRVCMVLEHAAGGSVASILAAKSSRALFSPSIRLYTAECLVSAIEYLHSKGIFHRDVKPENMCMHEGWEQTPQMVLIDFGIAKQVPNDVATATVTSNPGTELFMAPEYADKKVCHFDEKSEVFSIGAVMTCLITGSLSLLALGQAKDCDSQILFDQRDNTGGEWPDDVAMEFANIISRCNSVDPIKRPTVKNLVAAIKNVRALNGELGRLSPEAINRVQTHISLSQKSRLPESKTCNACARCGLDRCHGITCPDFHLVCTESTCLENMARSQMGSSTFRCPGKDCRNEFLLANLYGHINPDLYNELLMAKNQDDNAAFLMNGITSLIQALHDDFNGMVQLGLSEVKAEIRTSKDEMLLAMASQWTLVHHDTVVAQASIDQSIKHLKHYAEWLDRKESHLESQREKLSELEMNGAGNKDDIEKQLQEISTKLENLSLQNAKGVAYLASGRLQCPRLFILWPFRGPRRIRARRLIYKEYRLFFICEYDKTLVETSVTIKHVRAWLQKVAPFLKFAIFSIRVLVTVYGVPIPKLPDFIPGTNGEEKFNEVAEHMEKLLSDADSQALRSLNNFLEECSDCLNGDKLHALIREFEGDIPEEAYGALATIAYKPKNRGWMSEMEIANRGSEYAWVKKKNVEAFQSGTAVPQKFC